MSVWKASDEECDVLDEINVLRSDPAAYANKLSARESYYAGKIMTVTQARFFFNIRLESLSGRFLVSDLSTPMRESRPCKKPFLL